MHSPVALSLPPPYPKVSLLQPGEGSKVTDKRNGEKLKICVQEQRRSKSEYPVYSLISEPITAREKHYSPVGYMLTVDIYRAAERRVKYLTLVTDTEGDNCFSICPFSE